MKRAIVVFIGIFLAWTGVLGGILSHAQAGTTYLITITNQTPGQVITPPVVIVHSGSFSLFEPGSPATPELAALAENGETDPLTAVLALEPEVFDFAVGGDVILPGGSMSVQVSGSPNSRITAVGMLAVTNDAFIGLNGVLLIREKTTSIEISAYDAGSEFNSESCAYVPACGGGGVHDPAAAEVLFISIPAFTELPISIQPSMIGGIPWRRSRFKEYNKPSGGRGNAAPDSFQCHSKGVIQ